MNINSVKSLIKARHQAGLRRTVHIIGSPGLGKTQCTEQVANELKIGYKVIHAPLLQPEDYGFPVISGDRKNVDFVVSMQKFPIEGSDNPKEGIFCIDELPQTDTSGQKILANLVQTREIHGHRLLPGWSVITTGNRSTDKSGAGRILTHLGNRLTQIHLEVSLEDWITWAFENNVKPEVISFLRFRPNLLNDFKSENEVNPTPRSWAEGVSADLGVVDHKLEYEVIKGSVGEGAATEFLAYIKIFRNLPDLDEVLKKPEKASVPKDPATQYALIGALVHRTNETLIDPITRYIRRMPKEFQVYYMKDASKKCPEIKDTSAFVDWAIKEGFNTLV